MPVIVDAYMLANPKAPDAEARLVAIARELFREADDQITGISFTVVRKSGEHFSYNLGARP